jgi:hypothetical protein
MKKTIRYLVLTLSLSMLLSFLGSTNVFAGSVFQTRLEISTCLEKTDPNTYAFAAGDYGITKTYMTYNDYSYRISKSGEGFTLYTATQY